jgi:hypothetical protein
MTERNAIVVLKTGQRKYGMVSIDTENVRVRITNPIQRIVNWKNDLSSTELIPTSQIAEIDFCLK